MTDDPASIAHHRKTLTLDPRKDRRSTAYPLDATGTTDQRRRDNWSKWVKWLLDELINRVPPLGPITPFVDATNHLVGFKDAGGTTIKSWSGQEADDIIYCLNALGTYSPAPPPPPPGG